MALTYINLASVTLTGPASQISFNNIPQTYTDLVIYLGTRIDGPESNGITTQQPRPNNQTTTGQNFQAFQGNVSAVRNASAAPGFSSNTQTTANVYGIAEIYIPYYQNSGNRKPFYYISHTENNVQSDVGISITAGLMTFNDSIDSLVVQQGAVGFVAGSTAYLYGISNT